MKNTRTVEDRCAGIATVPFTKSHPDMSRYSLSCLLSNGSRSNAWGRETDERECIERPWKKIPVRHGLKGEAREGSQYL